MALKPDDKVEVDGQTGRIVRIVKDGTGDEIGADVEIAGVVERYYSDEIKKIHE